MSKAGVGVSPRTTWLEGFGGEPIILRGDDPSFAGLCRGVSLIQRQMQYMTHLVNEVIKSCSENRPSHNLSQLIDTARRHADPCGLTLPQKDEAVGYLKKHAMAAYSPVQRVTSATNLDDHAAQEIQRMRMDDVIHLRME